MRGFFVDGPFKGNCCVLEREGKTVCHLHRLPMLPTKPFRGQENAILATPCREDEAEAVIYLQQRNEDGSPQLNLVGDVLYKMKSSS